MKRLFRLPFSRARLSRDVDAELTFHLQGRIEELIAQGMSRENAQREAQRRFGDRVTVEAELERIDLATHKRRALGERFAALGRDTRYASRGLRRRPLYALAVIVTLALAIGANTAVFSVFKTVLLQPLPVYAIDRLAVVQGDYPLMNQRFGVSALEAIDLFERRDLFTSATASSGIGATVVIGGEPTRLSGATTIGEFANVFGVLPMLGRFYRPEDSQYGRPAVLVLSHRLWQQLGGDSAVVGQILPLSDKPYEVVGVMPPDFNFPAQAAFWRPLVLDSLVLNQEQSRGTVIQRFVGRMRDGLTIGQLAAELRALEDRWHQAYLSNYKVGGHRLVVTPLVDILAGQLKPIVIALLAAVTLVLLIACANVASLQLVHASGRTRELAVRAALGAGRGAIARQVVIESAILAVAGGVAGIALGILCLTWVTKLNIARFPALKDLQLDGMVLAFTAGTVLLAGILFGSAPAFRAARVSVNDALRDSTRGASAGVSRHRFLRASVVLQNALTLVLLIGAGLTIRSLDRLLRIDTGFQPENLISFTLSLAGQRYPEPEQRLAFFRSLDDRLRAIPGVRTVGFALGAPFSGSAGSTMYTLPGIPKQSGEGDRHANQAFVYGDYFRTMGIPIVRGRAFTAADYASGGHTIIVDETLVRQSFGDRDPIGAEIEHGPKGTIIGVAQSVKLNELSETPHPLVYHDYGHTAWVGALTAVVRSTLPPAITIKASRAAVAELDPSLPTTNARALTERIAESYGSRQFATRVLTGFAALSLVIALLGTYAVMSYVVSTRSREIGIRLALGAARAEIARMVLRDGALLGAIGLALGAAAFLALGRLLNALLFGVSMLDPLTLAGAVGLIAVITLVASYIPARRAVKVDPLVTMRAE